MEGGGRERDGESERQRESVMGGEREMGRNVRDREPITPTTGITEYECMFYYIHEFVPRFDAQERQA